MLIELKPDQLRRLAKLDPCLAAFEAGLQGMGLDVFDDPETGENLVVPDLVTQPAQPVAAPELTERQP